MERKTNETKIKMNNNKKFQRSFSSIYDAHMQRIRLEGSDSTFAARSSAIELRFKFIARSSYNERMRKVINMKLVMKRTEKKKRKK